MISRIVTFGAIVALATPAMGQTIDAGHPASLVAALQTAGYKAILDKDSDGDPRIKSAASGANFAIYFYGCEKNTACRSVQFTAGYTMKVEPPLQKMNEWNLKNRFAAAYLDDDGQPNIQWDIVLEGGMSQPLFAKAVDHWTEAMGAFQTFIGW